MKKKICLVLSLIMVTVALYGCGLFEHNYEKDYAQKIATIASIPQTVTVMHDTLDDYGDVSGSVEFTLENEFVSPQINIYKSTLVNYVSNYASTYINSGYTVEKLVDEILNMLIDYELILVEADKLFFAGTLYWTQDDVDEIQRSVYATIDQELFDISNNILKKKKKPLMSKPEEEVAAVPTYPIMPAEEDDEDEAAKYEEYEEGTATYDATRKVWSFDKWYLDADDWYMEDQEKYLSAWPGMFGKEDDKSLAREAMNAYLEVIYARSKIIIGITDAQKKQVESEVKALKKVQKSQGPEFVYPMLGRTMLIKFLIGDTLIKSKKMDKVEGYVSKELVSVTEAEVINKYNIKLDEQRKLFSSALSNYNKAAENGDLLLYTASDRYVFVKHILIPFSEEQAAKLDVIGTEEGIDKSGVDREKGNRDAYEKRRADLAEQITAYAHVNGEDDLDNPKTLTGAYNEIKSEMAKYTNNAFHAERAFDKLIYKYSTDYDKENKVYNGLPYGYPVIAKLGDDEKDNWMLEFAEGAREFRSEPQYGVGNILDHYVVTDYGVHIMYYAADPMSGSIKEIQDPTTTGAYKTVYQIIEQQLLSDRQDAAYSEWSKTYIDDFKEDYAVIKSKLVDKYVKELKK